MSFLILLTIYSLNASLQSTYGEWLAALPRTKDKDGPNILSKALILCWQIWEARNNCVFKDIAPHPVRALNVAGHIGLDYWKINSTPPQKSKGELAIKWKPQPLDWVKLNFDGSVCGNLAATGFVIRDWNGNVWLTGAKNSGQISINVVNVWRFVMVSPMQSIMVGAKF
ncbi:unnamed protein product [Prunus armeniaca]